MAPQPKLKPSAAVAASDAAPFVFFDFAYGYGSNGSVVQMELGAFTLVPIQGTNKVVSRAICTGHLRMSPTAAASLRDSLTKALERFATSAPAAKN
jgi:hypothetical protein